MMRVKECQPVRFSYRAMVMVSLFGWFSLVMCQNQNQSESASDSGYAPQNKADEMVAAESPVASDQGSSRFDGTPGFDVSSLKLVKTGEARIEVDDYPSSKALLDSIIHHHQALVSSENEIKSGARIENQLVIRTPSHRFDDLFAGLVAIPGRVEIKTIHVKDVTEEFIDIEARLKSKKELEQRYLSILTKAVTVKDILEVESNLNVVREEVESAQGKLNFLKDQVAMSTITLTFYKNLPVPMTRRSHFMSRLKTGWIEGWYLFLSILVGLSYLWVYIVGGLLIFIYIRKRIKRRMKPPIDAASV
ncbi:MAG: DUF4349 domain-containing protein [Candidatus Delongbacteria bacterium]|nr:DUF4349 domain-containing protein [Candidatus Delongbacteria bacterium]